MNKTQIEEKICKIINDLGFSSDSRADVCLYDIGMDDLDITELVVLLEEEFDVKISTKEEKLLYDKAHIGFVYEIIKNKL